MMSFDIPCNDKPLPPLQRIRTVDETRQDQPNSPRRACARGPEAGNSRKYKSRFFLPQKLWHQVSKGA